MVRDRNTFVGHRSMGQATIHSTEIITSVDGIGVLLLLLRHEVDRGPCFMDEPKAACVETLRNANEAQCVHHAAQ